MDKLNVIQAEEIIGRIIPLEFSGDRNSIVTEPVSFDPENVRPDVIMWCSEKNLHVAARLKKGSLICPSIPGIQPVADVNYFVVKNPRLAFLQVLRDFFQAPVASGIAASASIHPSAKLPQQVFIGEHVVIESDVTIGEGSRIGHNSVIHAACRIGRKVIIGANCTIGGVGFGYEKNENGSFEQMPHLGNVVIEDGVEIGNNTCIDRAVIGSTIIGRNVRIDNLVHIAHGVSIGADSLIIANAMIGGSVRIGDNCWIAPSSSVLNKVEIGKDTLVGMGAVVIRDVPSNTIVAGNPAKVLRKRF